MAPDGPLKIVPLTFLTVAILSLLCLSVFVAPILATAQDGNPQPPPSDGDQVGVLDTREKVTLLAVSLWVFVQVPVALLMRMWANERGGKGNVWLVLGALPVLGYPSWIAFWWIIVHRPPVVGRTPSPSLGGEGSGS